MVNLRCKNSEGCIDALGQERTWRHLSRHVCFTPNSGHQVVGLRCPLSANRDSLTPLASTKGSGSMSPKFAHFLVIDPS